jgi:glycosyltransferase involved in cell wall biosynthesis
VIGFLDKANPADRTRFSEILTRAHFLVHPAHAECSGIVLCEANAYAVPCLASDTGGIPELIRPGINGALFPTNSDGTSYADFIVDCLSDHGKYYALARNAYEEYRRSLNWRTSGSRARNEIERILMLGPPAVVPEQGNGGPRDPIAPNRGNGLKIELGDVEPLSPSHPV